MTRWEERYELIELMKWRWEDKYDEMRWTKWADGIDRTETRWRDWWDEMDETEWGSCWNGDEITNMRRGNDETNWRKWRNRNGLTKLIKRKKWKELINLTREEESDRIDKISRWWRISNVTRENHMTESACGTKILVTRMTGGNPRKIYRFTQVTIDCNTLGEDMLQYCTSSVVLRYV